MVEFAMSTNEHTVEPRYILLTDWAKDLPFCPSLFTLRKWAREAAIEPAPVKIGKLYYVEPQARAPKVRGTLRAQVAAAPTFLYRHFAGDGRLLYVGISLRPFGRTDDHGALAKWFADVRTITLAPYPNRDAANAAEKAAILAERPLHNIIHARKP